MKVYISGPMTGLPGHNFPAFNAAAKQLRSLGVDVVNPVEVCRESGGKWHDYMKADIKALCDCDGLVLLDGWQHSNGAQLELNIAHRLQMEIETLNKFVEDRK